MGSSKLLNSESGQILLVSILVAVIALTIGLSVATRTITNTKVSTEETNSQKALAAAEAGVEQLANKTDSTTAVEFSAPIGDASFKANAVGIAGKEILLNGGASVAADDGADIWLSDYPKYDNPLNFNSGITLYWNDKSNDDCTALEVVVISGAKDNPAMSRYAFDKCSGAHLNGFTLAGINSVTKKIQDISFNRSVSIPSAITSGRVMRVIPIYNSSVIGAMSNDSTDFPAQGLVIQSQGTAGNVTRRVRVNKSYPKLPTEFFPYSLFQP